MHGYQYIADTYGTPCETFHWRVKGLLFRYISRDKGLTLKSPKFLLVHHSKQGSSECFRPCFICRTLQISTANIYSKIVETVNLFNSESFVLFLIAFCMEPQSRLIRVLVEHWPMMVLVTSGGSKTHKNFLMVRKCLICFNPGPYERQFIIHFFFVPDNNEDNSSSGNSGLDLETQVEIG